jgi:hypothetical protein
MRLTDNGLLVPGSDAEVEAPVVSEGKSSLRACASVFRLWVAENPPQDGVLLKFVTDMLRSMELCDGNFEKVLKRMAYVDEFTSGFVESVQARLEALEMRGVVDGEHGQRGSSSGSSSEGEFGRSGVSGSGERSVCDGDGPRPGSAGDASINGL